MRTQMGISLNRSSLNYFSPLIGNLFYSALKRIRTQLNAFKRIGAHSTQYKALKMRIFFVDILK